MVGFDQPPKQTWNKRDSGLVRIRIPDKCDLGLKMSKTQGQGLGTSATWGLGTIVTRD